jgi:F0F1-type ATP synthase membrane subunit b/b'
MNFGRRFLTFSSTLFLALFLAAIPVLAAEGSEPDPVESPTGLIFRWLNFILVFGVIGYLIAKNGGSFFSANAKAIAASIREGTAAKEEAEHQLQEVNTKISHLNQEVDELRAAARRDSVAETERLNTSGAVEIEKIRLAARAELAASEQAAKQELRVIAASLAVEQAGAVVNSRMNPELRAKMFNAFLTELKRSSN